MNLISIVFKFFDYFLISDRDLENDVFKLKLIKKSWLILLNIIPFFYLNAIINKWSLLNKNEQLHVACDIQEPEHLLPKIYMYIFIIILYNTVYVYGSNNVSICAH